MRLGLACLVLSAAIIAAVWAWLGSPVAMPQAQQTAGDKLYCVSYAPFRGAQTPFDSTTFIPAAQIEEDLTLLARLTDCVRIYSDDQGLEQVAGIAARLGLKVMQGFWLSGDTAKNRERLEAAVLLANRYPDTIRAVVVGNEVLLRGDLSAPALIAAIREVKARVRVPVTYADVWEFWLKNRDVAAAVDFVTIHILPYWEDFPIPAEQAAGHVDAIRRQLVDAFAGKEVIIGEFGWPSAGRMREGALPSPANQARVVQDVLALAKRDKAKINVIEAFDQPWKRALEGTVGGHWGLIDDNRLPKFEPGGAVSNHPLWRWQAGTGIAFAILVFGAALYEKRGGFAPPSRWLAVTANALAGGVLIGWTFANVPIESLGTGGWMRSLASSAAALLAAPVLSAATMRGTPLPRLSALLGPAGQRSRDALAWLIGVIVIAAILLAFMVALGLVFDPRYKDFPFAPLTAIVVPLLTHSLAIAAPNGERGTAELVGATVLALSVPYIVFNEGLANWQSLWVCAALAALAVSLARVRGAQG
jgi:exo-beta-1,3-glucanase (GH17 family)